MVAIIAGSALLLSCGVGGNVLDRDTGASRRLRSQSVELSAVATTTAAPATPADTDRPSTGSFENEGHPGADDLNIVGSVERPGNTSTLVAHAVVNEIVAHAGPASTRIVATFTHPNRHGGPLVFRSLTQPDSDLVASGWIPVLLPVRPNGTVGWIQTSTVELTRNPFRIEVDVDDFTLTVFRNNERYFTTEVGIGEGDTPTPIGSFYVTDLLRPSNPAGIYGPYAYGLSGYSETLDSFNGGPGVIGIHGTNQPEAIGTRVSHGCIRVANEAISEMADFLPLGTPVIIGVEPSDAESPYHDR